MSENGQVDTAAAERAVEAVAGQAVAEPAKLWLHPDALRPRDYIRGKLALKDVLAEAGLENCYDFLGTEYMYPWLMWALESRTDTSFTWEQALDRDFWHYRMGDDQRPQTPPSEPLGRSGSTRNESGSTRRRPKLAPAPSSASSSDSPEPSTTTG